MARDTFGATSDTSSFVERDPVSSDSSHGLIGGVKRFVAHLWGPHESGLHEKALVRANVEAVSKTSESLIASAGEGPSFATRTNVKQAIDALADNIKKPVAFHTDATGKRVALSNSELAEKLAAKPVQRQIERMTCDWKVKQLTVRLGTTHGHTRASDGMGSFQDIFDKGASEGQDVTSITDHNHDRCRAGEQGEKDQERIDDQAKSDMIADDPSIYTQQLKYAKDNSNDNHVDIAGVECGTINAKDRQGNHGGNHTIVFAATQPLIAEFSENDQHSWDEPVGGDDRAEEVRPSHVPKPGAKSSDSSAVVAHGHSHHGQNQGNVAQGEALNRQAVQNSEGLKHDEDNCCDDGAADAGGKSLRGKGGGKGGHNKPGASDAVFYLNGDYKELADKLNQMKDITGQHPIVYYAHPNEKSKDTDYGFAQFGSNEEYLKQYGQWVRGIEVIRGEALNPNHVSQMKQSDLIPWAMDYYFDKGIHAAPVVGRDNHWGDPGDRPASTGFLADKMTQEGILEAMRERRCFATTNSEKLEGFVTANDNQFVMGNIIDSSKIKELDLQATIGGDLNKSASYVVNLVADTHIGDGQGPETVQTLELSGQQLADANGVVTFDPIKVNPDDKAYYRIEVKRQDPNVKGWQDHLYLAPIWTEPGGDPDKADKQDKADAA